MRVILVLGLFFSLVIQTVAVGEVSAVGVRGFEPQIDPASGIQLIRSKTMEFENGNTFVRFLDGVIGHDVQVWIPEVLTPNLLMEALIKVRIAHGEGARSVTVVCKGSLDRIKLEGGDSWMPLLPMGELFQLAGTQYVHETVGLRNRLTPAQPPLERFIDLRPHSLMVVGNTHPRLSSEIASKMGVPFRSLAESLNYSGRTIVLVAPSTSPVNESFFRSLAQIRALKRSDHSVLLVTPYLPYARSDKKDQPGVAITGRLVADLIEGLGADAVSFVRAHAPQSEGFFRIPTFHISSRRTIERYLKTLNVQAIVSPDTGFQKDATLFAVELGLPIDVINKQREVSTGASRIHMVGGVDLTGLTVAIPDDETATGGTLASSAAYLKSRGATKVVGVVTHLTGLATKALESEALDLLVVTDTNPILIASPKLRVLSIVSEIAEALQALHSDSCVDDLLKPTKETS